MAILGLYAKASDFGLDSSFDDTTAAYRNTDYCDSAISRSNNVSGPTISSGGGQTDVWFHWDAYAPGASIIGSSTDGTWWTASMAGNLFVRCKWTNGELYYEAATNSNYSSSSQSGRIQTPFYLNVITFDVNIRLDDGGNDIVDIYHGGVLFSSLSIAHTTSTSVDSLSFNNADSNSDIFYSQLIVADESTIGLKTVRMDPDGAGSASAWSGDYTNIIEANDGQGMISGTGGERESWTIEDYTGPASPVGIRGLFVVSNAAEGPDGGPTGFQHTVEISSTVYDGPTISNPLLSKQSITEFADNPATSSPWATTELDALIIGVESIT